jgi:hypothetical protein
MIAQQMCGINSVFPFFPHLHANRFANASQLSLSTAPASLKTSATALTMPFMPLWATVPFRSWRPFPPYS